eukprot:177964_1
MSSVFLLLLLYISFIPSINCQPPGGKESNSGPKCDIYGKSASYSETISDQVRNIKSSGCPNHNSECIGKVGICEEGDGITEATERDKDINIPAYPCISDYSGDGFAVNCILDELGIALNGVSIFSPAADQECTDAVEAEKTTFDHCGGHATMDGNYHYHLAPSCLLDILQDADTINKNYAHSAQIGWIFDGFPIYGPHGLNGEYINLCSDTNANQSDCLDSCGGHMQHTIDGFTYHYHIAGPIGDLITVPVNPTPDTDKYPYTIGCFRGIPYDWSLVKSSNIPTMNCAMNGTTNDYVAEAMNGVVALYDDGTTSTTAPEDTSTSTSSIVTQSTDTSGGNILMLYGLYITLLFWLFYWQI